MTLTGLSFVLTYGSLQSNNLIEKKVSSFLQHVSSSGKMLRKQLREQCSSTLHLCDKQEVLSHLLNRMKCRRANSSHHLSGGGWRTGGVIRKPHIAGTRRSPHLLPCALTQFPVPASPQRRSACSANGSLVTPSSLFLKPRPPLTSSGL